GDLLADVRGADQIESESAVSRRDLEPQQIERRGLSQQLPRQLPVVFVETIHDRQHFLLHEFGGGPAEHPLFFAEILADEHLVRAHVVGEKLPGGHRSVCVGHRCYLTVQRLGSISLTSCRPSTIYSLSPAVLRSSPADRAVSVRKWPKGSPKPARR